jgi:hypothetical protein
MNEMKLYELIDLAYTTFDINILDQLSNLHFCIFLWILEKNPNCPDELIDAM